MQIEFEDDEEVSFIALRDRLCRLFAYLPYQELAKSHKVLILGGLRGPEVNTDREVQTVLKGGRGYFLPILLCEIDSVSATCFTLTPIPCFIPHPLFLFTQNQAISISQSIKYCVHSEMWKGKLFVAHSLQHIPGTFPYCHKEMWIRNSVVIIQYSNYPKKLYIGK